MNGWSLLITAHAGAAALCLLLGGFQLLRPTKGDRVHRIAGWVWVLAMLWVVTSSFFIRELADGRLSVLHILSVVSFVSMVLGIVNVRRGDVPGHRRAMAGGWFGLVGAFIGAVAVPDRRIPTLAVTDPAALAVAVAAVAGLTALVIAVATVVDRLLGRQTATGASANWVR